MSTRPDHTLKHTVGRRTFLKVLGSAAPASAVAALLTGRTGADHPLRRATRGYGPRRGHLVRDGLR